FVRPAEPGRYPLALINHGSPRSPKARPGMTPMQLLPQATEFARRGWAAAAVLRRGYGHSGGPWAEDYHGCANADYYDAGLASAADLAGIVSELGKRPDVDATRVVSVGVSAGGFATVALTADPPAGLRAAISFAGGRGSLTPDTVCSEAKLIDAFRKYGKRSRIPCYGSTRRTTTFLARVLPRNSRTCLPPAAAMLNSSRPRRSGKTAIPFFRPASRNGPRSSMIFSRVTDLSCVKFFYRFLNCRRFRRPQRYRKMAEMFFRNTSAARLIRPSLSQVRVTTAT